MVARIPVIDTQTHYVPPAAAQLLARWSAGDPVPGLSAHPDIGGSPDALEVRLRVMDEAGIDVSVLSFAPIGLIDDPSFRRELYSAANDGMAAVCASHPDRFVMAAAIPLPEAGDALRELRRVQARDCVRAIHVVAQTTAYLPDRLGLDLVFDAAAEAGLPIILHPTAGAVDLGNPFDAYGLGSGMHAMVSHALVAARIVQSGMLDRIAGLELILTHLGGILPFLIDRLDSRAGGPAAFPPSHYLRNRIWVDACGYPAGPALRCALETLGAGRVMIGSDWPSRPIAPALEAIRDLGLDDGATRAIMGETAARWFDPSRPRVG
jgi:predicted TIM-barrel fold metal-dependent hydrolase